METVHFLGTKQCFFYAGSEIVFQSYKTIVCTVENYEKGNHPIVKITTGQPQSRTTAKYLNMFLKQIIGIDNYKDLKKYGY